ncbi:MAG TPA: squalene synthase HpnC [Vicinamibacterales bacterium]|nr:squalene synthase HpnC [Vicinamibacterales bacterium]
MRAEGTQIEASTLGAAYAECERLTRAHYENFPVASWLVPARMRPHIAALYAFARTADDFADEGSRSAEERMRLLDDWQQRLHACVVGRTVKREGGLDQFDQIFIALGATIRARDLPVSLFDDLLSAFRQDITTHRYQNWDALLDYCRRSANPVGRLVLRIAGYEEAALDRSSDALCTALQLTNFWQDLDRDWQKGRLYVPVEDVEACHARMQDLDDRRLTEPWQRALRGVTARTRDLFEAGRHCCDGVSGRLRHELRLTWLGGMRILDRVERVDHDVFLFRPTLGLLDAPPLLWRALWWRGRPAAQ